MIIQSEQAEQAFILETAQAMVSAARTAPKTRGQDKIKACILTGDDLLTLADKMEQTGRECGQSFFVRDAGVVRLSGAVVLLAVQNEAAGLGNICQYCGFEDCAQAVSHGASCAFNGIDLGIAIGSAVSIAADRRVDNRILFSGGEAARALGYFDSNCKQVLAVPLSVRGKSPFFDRIHQFGEVVL